ncbi:Fis family transcriptional regulator [Rhizobium sp. Root274]|uniref:sigma-54-dependent transcriptional regulator n=1 Tax=unclassified Rhizobium TaxID=2613769 RepID=UPI0007130705|nr:MULTISPECIES: sigma-54 dependent transcriptional regulator [unclassified Rhizobium]KQW29310.1 Fis family transcriptional regulator [Rhizobium sp. Root1240]KRD29505.1 Fis family transcriptional regulator [Rhizobium sp. Root274]
MTSHILLIDEDAAERRSMKAAIEAHGHVVHAAETAHAAIDAFRRQRDQIGVVIVDASAPEGLQSGLLAVLAEINPAVPVLVATAEGATETALDAVRAGAFDFLVKPFAPERLSGAVEAALKIHRSSLQGRTPRRARSGAVSFTDIVAASASMSRVVELGRRAAQSTIPVMLEGEGGVGKELVARAIHAASDRSSRAFVTLNCHAFAPAQIDGVLFGDARFADTEGVHAAGKFGEAEGGTLFIEEISELPASAQARLLDVVQSGELVRGDPPRAAKVNVRLVLATNKDLIEEVKAGRFREDLYYRLNVFPITIPALRRRKEDIPHLVRAFVERFSLEQRLPRSLQVEASAIALLTAFDWPGNTRQLENAIFRAVVLAEGGSLGESDFPQISAQVSGHRSGAAHREAGEARDESSPLAKVQAALAERTASFVSQPSSSSSTGFGNVQTGNVIVSTDEAGNVRKLAEIEEELIRFALKFYRGQMSQVARKLGIGRSTLYRKLKDYGIDPDDPQKDAA